ncbi:DUF6685 family protein [Cronobacter malonaticus]
MGTFSEAILKLYKFTDHSKLTNATYKSLEDIRLVKPTADADTIFQLEKIFDEYALRYVTPELADILSTLINKETTHNPSFEFNKINSLTASKSFGCSWNKTVNGSWFKNLYLWGEAMYPAKNLKAENLSDWNDNKNHIESEGFRLSSPISVRYYSWLDRYVASNTGGSHHAAMVVYQSVRDKLQYKREAIIETLSINKKALSKLEKDYFSFIFQNKTICDKYTSKPDFEYALQSFIKIRPDFLTQPNYINDTKIAFIPKKNLKGNKGIFQEWLELAIDSGKIIPLPRYMEDPLKFHKHDYSHGVDAITLGDPARKYQKI